MAPPGSAEQNRPNGPPRQRAHAGRLVVHSGPAPRSPFPGSASLRIAWAAVTEDAMPSGSAMPLIGLDAVVIDCETTGLDPAKARIVDLAAVRLTGGKMDAAGSFDSPVRPPEPIPRAATAIHGIDDAAVAEAPLFAEVWPDFSAYA